MAAINLAHLMRLSQQLSHRLEHIDGLMLQVWTEHLLAHKALRNLSDLHDQWLNEGLSDDEE